MNDLMKRLVARLAPTKRGQTIVEYGLILSFLALVVVVVLGQLRTAFIPPFQSAAAGF